MKISSGLPGPGVPWALIELGIRPLGQAGVPLQMRSGTPGTPCLVRSGEHQEQGFFLLWKHLIWAGSLCPCGSHKVGVWGLRVPRTD